MGETANDDSTIIVECLRGCGGALAVGAVLLIPTLLAGWACTKVSELDDPSADLLPDERTLYVEESGFPGTWPLTVDFGTIRCDRLESGGEAASFISPNRIRYGLNGSARSQLDLPKIDPIWKDDPSVPGAKVDASDLLDTALALC